MIQNIKNIYIYICMYRPVGELLKSWVHGCLIQACFVGHRKDVLMHPCTHALRMHSCTHALRIWVVHLLVYSAPLLQVEHCLGFAGEHLTEYMYVYIDICKKKTKQNKTNKQTKTTCNKGRADRGLGWGENRTICLLSNVIRVGEEDTTKRKKVTITSSKKTKQNKTKQKNKQNKQKKAVDLYVSLLLAGCLSRIQDNTEPGA